MAVRTNGEAGKTSVRIEAIRERARGVDGRRGRPKREEFDSEKQFKGGPVARRARARGRASPSLPAAAAVAATSPRAEATGSSGKTYPLLHVVCDAPDYMDPGLSYTVAAYQVDNYV